MAILTLLLSIVQKNKTNDRITHNNYYKELDSVKKYHEKIKDNIMKYYNF